MISPAGWSVTASADNAQVTATKGAVQGKQHILYSVTAGFTAAVAGKIIQIKDGAAVVWEAPVHNTLHAEFPRGIAAAPGNALSAVLAASGTAATIGVVSITGVTVG